MLFPPTTQWLFNLWRKPIVAGPEHAFGFCRWFGISILAMRNPHPTQNKWCRCDVSSMCPFCCAFFFFFTFLFFGSILVQNLGQLHQPQVLQLFGCHVDSLERSLYGRGDSLDHLLRWCWGATWPSDFARKRQEPTKSGLKTPKTTWGLAGMWPMCVSPKCS